jgi:DNA modification methylase
MKPYYADDLVSLYHGDAERVAGLLESGSVRTIVTSPPYFGLRDYGEDGQIGAEESLDEYVAALVALFRELRRVLSDDGTLWLNLGDSYVGGGSASPQTNSTTVNGVRVRMPRGATPSDGRAAGVKRTDAPPKNLLGVPWRVAFALQADGWILRSDIIWAKPNPMPESVTDRPTKAHEYVFLFAKSPKYYYDAAAIAEAESKGSAGSSFAAGKTAVHQLDRASKKPRVDDGKRNKRTVWDISTVPFPGAHFAAYPPELIRPCILAGSAPGDTVLDPFSGSGTTGMVATQEGRKYIGIDLNRDYLDLSLRTRFAQPVLNIGA